MKQEEKDLLLKDLCARLSYELKISVNDKVEKVDGVNVLDNTIEYGSWLSSEVEEVKPYLFPLSSMTEEQLLELSSISFENSIDSSIKTLNWCYKNHFDIYNLIPMGLAIDATGKNIY